MKHIVITPVYNEEEYLIRYINSVINQTCTPDYFLLVDDNSKDKSLEIIQEFSKKYDWIHYVHCPSEQKKVQGSKVIEAFNYGLTHSKINIKNYDIISKLDADLELPNNYFEEIISAFDKNPKAGLIGGYVIEMKNGEWRDILSKDYHVRGALKSYRTSCYIEIGGLMPLLGWDGLDEMKIFYNKWETKNINIGVKHYRPADSDYKPVKLYYKKGIVNYQNGGSFVLMLIRALKRSTKKPYLIASLAFIVGYLNAFFSRKPKNVSASFAKFINRFHMNRIFRMNKK